MSARIPILANPVASAERVAIEILALMPEDRPIAIQKAERTFHAVALAEDRTEGEAKFFAESMRRLITEAVQRIVARNGGAIGRA